MYRKCSKFRASISMWCGMSGCEIRIVKRPFPMVFECSLPEKRIALVQYVRVHFKSVAPLPHSRYTTLLHSFIHVSSSAGGSDLILIKKQAFSKVRYFQLMKKVYFIIRSQIVLYIYTNSNKIRFSANRCQEDNMYLSLSTKTCALWFSSIKPE